MELSSLFLAGKGSALTSFFSTAFLVVFLPFCLVVYSLMPRRGKKYFLLAADCAFFWLISGKLLVYLLLTALSMHYFGLWLDKIQSETKLLLAQTEKAERKTVRKRQQAVQHRILCWPSFCTSASCSHSNIPASPRRMSTRSWRTCTFPCSWRSRSM